MVSPEIFIKDKNKQPPVITLVIMGFLVFSPFSTILVMKYFGLPISLPEVLFLPFLFIFRKRYYFASVVSIRSIIIISSWILLILISILEARYTVTIILSSSRTYLTLLIAYLFFSKANNVTLDDVMYISLGVTLGWLYSSIYEINSYLTGDVTTIALTGNMLAIPLLISIAAFKKHNKILFFSIILLIAVSITSGMRREIVVFVVSLFLTFGFMSVGNTKQFLSKLFIISIPVIFFFSFYSQIGKYVESNVPVLYYRVFQKTEMLFSSKTGNTGDSDRLNNMSNKVNNFSEYLIPRGFVTRRTLEDDGGGYIDFPLSELLYMFGFLLTFILLLIFGIQTFHCYKRSSITDNDGIIFVILSMIMFMLLFLEGTFLSSSYVAPFTGYCLGRLKFHSKLTFVL